ncbi:MAG: hypothetical protein ABI665_11305 [Vicinamibacterales bacterium]
MNYGTGVALMFMMFPTAIVAAIVGWWALRPTPLHWGRLIWAYFILLIPFWLAVLRDSRDGFLLAVDVASYSLVTPIVGVALTVFAIRKNKRDQAIDEPSGNRPSV